MKKVKCLRIAKGTIPSSRFAKGDGWKKTDIL